MPASVRFYNEIRADSRLMANSVIGTPHDLRRTAATLAGDLGFDDAWIAKCLDHTASRKQEQIVPSVTGKVYNHSKR